MAGPEEKMPAGGRLDIALLASNLSGSVEARGQTQKKLKRGNLHAAGDEEKGREEKETRLLATGRQKAIEQGGGGVGRTTGKGP